MIRRGDERAVSSLIGAVLLLGIIVTALALYQVNVVPDQNQGVEYEHNQKVQEQLQDLRNTMVSVPGGNAGGSNSVTLGTTYPQRSFLVNPSPPTGTIETTELGSISIANANTTDDREGISEYWDGGEWTRNTTAITYTPRYNEYRNAPRTTLEHGLAFNQHPNDAVLPLGDQIVIEDDEITIITMQGRLSQSSRETVSVRTRAFSTSTNTVSIESEGDLEITLPTDAPQLWESELGEQDAVSNTEIDANAGTITVTLAEGEYDLTMAEVGVGDATRDPANDRVEYLVPIDKRAPSVVVEVRDQFNNPVRNADVVNNGDGDLRSTTTGSDGRVIVDDVEAGNEVSLEAGDTGADVAFEVESGGSSGDGGGDGGSGGAYAVAWESGTGPYEVSESDDTVSLTMGTDPVADGASVSYEVGDSSLIQDGDTSWKVGETNSNGQHTTSLPIDIDELENRGDTATLTVYTISGGSGDSIEIELERVEDDGTDESPAIDMENPRIGEADSIIVFDLVNNGENTVEISGISIDSTNSSATRVNNGGSNEVVFSGGGELDAGGGQSGINIGSGEQSLDENEIIDPGTSSQVTIGEFEEEGNGGRPKADMNGKEVVVTFYFTDDNVDPIQYTIVIPEE
ncbi:hypothetical protein ACLI4R_08220 [Natrialbaceae archaeon A-chndr2]